MVRNVKRPSLFKDEKTIEERLKQVEKGLINGTLEAGAEAALKYGGTDVEVKRMPKYLQVTDKRLKKLGVIDLKPYFSRSPKRTIKPDGGWYLRIPIKRKARQMSRRMYEQLRAIDISPDEKRTVISDYLYDRRRESDATMLNYQPKSHNIEKRKSGRNRHVYTAYRTVSDKSPVNSWIINRNRVNTDDTSKTFVENVNRLIRWKMRNGWG